MTYYVIFDYLCPASAMTLCVKEVDFELERDLTFRPAIYLCSGACFMALGKFAVLRKNWWRFYYFD